MNRSARESYFKAKMENKNPANVESVTTIQHHHHPQQTQKETEAIVGATSNNKSTYGKAAGKVDDGAKDNGKDSATLVESSPKSQQQSAQENTVTATTTATPPPQSAPPMTVSMNTSNTTSSSTDPSTFVTSTTNSGNVTNRSFTNSVTSNESRRMHSEGFSKTNLYIRGLPASTTDQDLLDMCARFGNISSTKAILDKVNGGCRGYGFVQFSTPHSAELAVQELTKSGIQAQMARISPGNPPHNHHHPHNNQYQNNHYNSHHNHQSMNNNHSSGNNPHSLQHNNNSLNNNHSNNADPTNLYIANLPLNMNEQELENLLTSFGPVVSTRILRDQINNSPRGVGFARMESRDKCQEIIDNLNGKPLASRGLIEPLLVKFADGGNKKRHHHSNHHSNNHHQHHHKINQDDTRWRENSNNVNEMGNLSNFDQSGNISHSNQLPDLAIMSTLSYPRIQPAFPPSIPGPAYPPNMGASTSGAPQWIHPVSGQSWNMIPQQMIQPGLNPPNQAAGFPFGHISQLTSQMQGLQIAHHPVAPVGGYLPAHHQWSPMWTHPMPPQQQQQQQQQPQQPQSQAHSMRLASPMQQHQPQQPQHQPQHRSLPQHQGPSHTSAQMMAGNPQDPPTLAKQQQTVADNKLQVTSPL